MVKKILFIVISLFVLASVFSIIPTSHTSGDKAIAEQKAREVFFLHHFPWTIFPYSIGISDVTTKYENSFFGEIEVHIYSVGGTLPQGFSPPIAYALVAVTRGKAFILPKEFNELISTLNLSIDSENKALELAKAYTFYSNPVAVFDDILILENASDIPWKGGKDPMELVNFIKPSSVNPVNDEYIIELFSWQEIGGIVEKWKLEVNHSGHIHILEKKIVERYMGRVKGLH